MTLTISKLETLNTRRLTRIPKLSPGLFFASSVTHALYLDSKLELTIQPDLLVQYTYPPTTLDNNNTTITTAITGSSTTVTKQPRQSHKCYQMTAMSGDDEQRGRWEDQKVVGRAVLVVIRHPFAQSIIDEAQSVLNNYKRCRTVDKLSWDDDCVDDDIWSSWWW